MYSSFLPVIGAGLRAGWVLDFLRMHNTTLMAGSLMELGSRPGGVIAGRVRLF